MKHQNMFTTREAYFEFRNAHRAAARDKALSFDDCLLYRAYMGKPLCAAVAPNTNPYILAYALKRVLGKIERDKQDGLDDEKRKLFIELLRKHIGYAFKPIHHQDLQAFDIELKIEQRKLEEAITA
jgi:hypothetical protein